MRHDRADGDDGLLDLGEPLEEIPWDEEEDAITARVFDELDKRWCREEQREARQ